MADPQRRDGLDAQSITAAFAGNASTTARALRVPCKVVIKAVQFVTAERDWLISLWEAGAICRSQCERLVVLLDLCPLDAHRPLQAEDVRKAAQTLPAHVHLQSGEVHSAIAFIVINLLPDGRASISSTCGGKPDASYFPMADARVGKEVNGLLAELRERLCGVTPQ